jgi:asparagine synthase (glutamine-hydrolysing)
MPGIVGIISKKSTKKNEKDLNVMVNTMLHEPFYTSGTYVNQNLGLHTGWICHEGSFCDCMPVYNENKNLIIIFTGEHLSDQNEKSYLKGKGHVFNESLATYLINLYEEYGKYFFEKLNGWFSGLLIDLRKSEITLFNDRVGMKRLFYYENHDEFLFSSEAKSLIAVRRKLKQLDIKSLGEFFVYGCALENRTLYRNVSVLPGSSAWLFKHGTITDKKRYFDKTVWENQPPIDGETYFNKLKKTFSRILPKYFKPLGSVAMSLTGGLDTRMIMACQSNDQDSLPCYTFGGIYRESLDVKIARKVASACGQRHVSLNLDGTFLKIFPELAEKTVYLSDGSLDVTGAADLYVNRMARQIAPIRLTGNYGDQVLARNITLKVGYPNLRIFDRDFLPYIETAKQSTIDSSREHWLSFVLFKQTPWHDQGRLALEQTQLTVRSPFLDNDLIELAYQASKLYRHRNDVLLRLIAECNEQLFKIKTDRGLGGTTGPLLSLLYRFFWGSLIKTEYYFDYGMPQWFAKFNCLLTPPYVKNIFLGHNKFYHFRIWYRDELSNYIKEILLDNKTMYRPFLNQAFLRRMVSNHTQGKGNFTKELNLILTIELIHRLFID